MTGGGQLTDEVRASLEDLRAFADAGQRYVLSLTSIAENVDTRRRMVTAGFGNSEELPEATAARSGHAGSGDSFAELITEATYNNGFVGTIQEALATRTTTDGINNAPTGTITAALQLAGYSTSGTDASLGEDRARLIEIRIRAELGDVVNDGIVEGELYTELEAVGGRVQDYIDGLSPEDRRIAGLVMVGYGIDLQAQVDQTSFSDVDHRRQTVTLLVTHGLGLIPDRRLGPLVDRLNNTTVETADNTARPALELLVDGLDLDNRSVLLSEHAASRVWDTWQGDVQPYYRQLHLDRLIRSTITSSSNSDQDGVISEGGQTLVDYTLDNYPSVVEAADNRTLHQAGFDERTAADFDLRSTLATALAAPNYGLSDEIFQTALRLDEVDAALTATDSQPEFERLWLERTALVAVLANSNLDTEQLINDAIGRGVPATAAVRLAGNAATADQTDLRVRRVRLVYETDPFGQPISPGGLKRLNANDDVTQSLFVELSVLQTIQEARFVGQQFELPLTPEQVRLVSDFGQMAPWFYSRVAGAYPGGIKAALEFVATTDEDTLASAFPDMPDGLVDLARQLNAGENIKIWELLPGASDNDTFLGQIGEYRSEGGRDYTTTPDFQALVIQMTLLQRLGPLAEKLGATVNGGSIHEDEIEAWLDQHRHDPNVPPALIDLITTGRSFGLGEDTFGWDEIGEIIGWVGLTAAVTATIVYSGGTAVPLWVQAGLVGLAGLEAYAFIKADDPFNAILAGVGGVADIVAAVRLIRQTQHALDIGVLGPSQASALTRNRLELVDLARRSGNAALRSLADESGHLDLDELLRRYRNAIGQDQGTVAKELVDEGIAPAQAREIVRSLDLPPQTSPLDVPTRGAVTDGNFAQNNRVNPEKEFSIEGRAFFLEASGVPVVTVADLAKALEAGTVTPAQVPVDYVVLDGQKLLLNTRSSTALTLAEVPRDQWYGSNKTGLIAFNQTTFDDLARAQLKRNGLSSSGSPTLGIEE